MSESSGVVKPSEDILHQAMEWQVTLWSGEASAQEKVAFDCWLRASPQHQLAWEKVQQIGRQLNKVPNQLAKQVLRKTTATDQGRRQLVLGLGIVCSLGILGFGASQTSQWQIASADYRTAHGERRHLTLPDGTRLTLNTASAVDVQFNADSRRLILHSGEIEITTGADSANGITRPFWVETTAGMVRPLGTQFTLRQLDKEIKAQVTEGAVELLPKQGQGVRLDAGHSAQFSQRGVTAPQLATPTDNAWTRGLLTAEQQRLDDFIAELSRYHPGVLRCDPAAADLIVSGVYPLKDTENILRALEQVLPIKTHTTLGYWTTVSLR